MIKNRTNGNHVRATEQATPLHLTLKSRATAAITAGCLALSMCPMVALAAPNADASQQGGRAPIEQQMPNEDQGFNGQQSPNGHGMANGQRPSDEQLPGAWQPAGGQQPAGEQPSGEQPAGEQQPGSDGWQMPGGDQAPMGQPEGGDDGFASGQVPADDQQFSDGEFGSGENAPSGIPGNQQPSDGVAPEGGQVPSDGQQPADGQQQPGDWQMPARDDQNQPAGAQGPREGQPAGDSAADAQVRDILADKYGVSTQMPEKGDAVEGADGTDGGMQRGKDQFLRVDDIPAVPEGEANVQQVIDTTRDIVREYGADALGKADFSDESFTTELADFANKSVDQRSEMFSSDAKPSDMTSPADEAKPGATTDANGAANESGQSASAKPSSENVSSSILDQIIEFLAGLFGFGSK